MQNLITRRQGIARARQAFLDGRRILAPAFRYPSSKHRDRRRDVDHASAFVSGSCQVYDRARNICNDTALCFQIAFNGSGNTIIEIMGSPRQRKFPGRLSTAGNLAFPFTPPEILTGAAYRFSVYHVMQVDELAPLFPVTVEEV